MPPTLLIALPDFRTFLRPCCGFNLPPTQPLIEKRVYLSAICTYIRNWEQILTVPICSAGPVTIVTEAENMKQPNSISESFCPNVNAEQIETYDDICKSYEKGKGLRIEYNTGPLESLKIWRVGRQKYKIICRKRFSSYSYQKLWGMGAPLPPPCFRRP